MSTLATPPADDEREALVGEALAIARQERIAKTRDGDARHVKIAEVLEDLAAGIRRQGPITDALKTIRSSWSVIRGAQMDMLAGRPDMDAMEEIALASSQIDDALEAVDAS